MEGPLLVLKSWLLTGILIWIYKRWFQRVAPRSPEFEALCAERPVVGAIWSAAGQESFVHGALATALGKRRASIATLGGYPWPHYRLELALERASGAVLLRVVGAQVVRTNDGELPALASVLRDVLNQLPSDLDAQAWLHAGAFANGLCACPAGGWAIQRGSERRPKLVALERQPRELAPAVEPKRDSRPLLRASAHFAFENHTPRLLP